MSIIILAFWPFNFDNKKLSDGSNLSELTDQQSFFDYSDDLDRLEDWNLLYHALADLLGCIIIVYLFNLKLPGAEGFQRAPLPHMEP